MRHRDVHIDFNNAIDPQQKIGISDEALESLAPTWLEVHRGLHAMAEMGQVQFTHLPYLEDTLRKTQSRAEQLREKFDTLVVLGIGGSALGAKAIQQACAGISRGSVAGPSNLYVWDTLDPNYIGTCLEKINPERTLFNVVSKSGNTVETMAQFMIVYDFLKSRLGPANFQRQIVMTTDPKGGALRELCQEEGFESFEILRGVGGRFSVLSPVGLFPAAFLGVSLEELVEGAMHMDKRCRLEDLWTNPAGMLAVVSYLLQKNLNRSQMVVLNYSESLQATVDWFAQLWAESLGKKQNLKGEVVHAGITPITASGPRDQHSQVQLYVEGPRDKFVMLWQQEKFERDVTIPKLYSDKESLSYLGGNKLSEILFAEVLATEQTLRENGVPNFKMTTLDTGPYNLGQIFFLMEVATVYAGGLFGVNPYDQPGVELGKNFTYGKLGREGYEKFGGVLARKLKEKRYLI
jgi:glucose-6-phosphate isomerase